MPDADATPPEDPTVAEMRARAGELDIVGRTRMSAEELAAAIDVAERKQAEAAAVIEAQRATSSSERRFTVARLRATPELHGYSVAVFAAAIAEAGLSDSDELTVAQLEQIVTRTLARPVQPQEA